MTQEQILKFHVFEELVPSIDLMPIKYDWENDLFDAITKNSIKTTILGIFFNVYKHAINRKPEYLYMIFLVMKKAWFYNSCFDKPNLFFEFFHLITTEENDMYTYVYYLLKLGKTRKTKLIPYARYVFFDEGVRYFAKNRKDIELKDFEESVTKR
jgi:hypothetical protein